MMNFQLLVMFLILLDSDLAQLIVQKDPKETLANYNSIGLPGPDVCGLPNNLVQQFNTRTFYAIVSISEDSETIQGEFPWMAGLEYNSNGGIRCGGFLINKRYVLTAAHCLNETEYTLISVWLGLWKMSTVDNIDADKVKKLDIEEKIRHESFQTEMDGYDIALLRLNEDVTFTDYVVPICLPKPDLHAPPLGTYLTVAGWGYVTESGPRSNILLKVDVPVVENNICKEVFNVPVADHQLCVGGTRGMDSCSGDSGGPLMLSFTNENGKEQWYPQGIVSYGYGCGRGGKPAVYTRISKYMNWILNKLK